MWASLHPRPPWARAPWACACVAAPKPATCPHLQSLCVIYTVDRPKECGPYFCASSNRWPGTLCSSTFWRRHTAPERGHCMAPVAGGWWLAVAVAVHRDECRAITRVSGSQWVAHTVSSCRPHTLWSQRRDSPGSRDCRTLSARAPHPGAASCHDHDHDGGAIMCWHEAGKLCVRLAGAAPTHLVMGHVVKCPSVSVV